MYAEDSFFTLTPLQGAGLLVLTGSLSISMLWCVRRVTKHMKTLGRLLVPICVFVLFVWLSPQIYYAYYLSIFEGLPVQVVIGRFPDFEDTLRYASFTGPANLSAHGQGLLFWMMLVVCLIPRRD